ncbi:hypothetical protein GCM10027033_30290 [Leucobacter ruminantium]
MGFVAGQTQHRVDDHALVQSHALRARLLRRSLRHPDSPRSDPSPPVYGAPEAIPGSVNNNVNAIDTVAVFS